LCVPLQVCLNMNVLMRSATQAAIVLFFMFAASWRLTVVTFVLVPLVLLISKVRAAGGSARGKGTGTPPRSGSVGCRAGLSPRSMHG
jgi:hypothetical protein